MAQPQAQGELPPLPLELQHQPHAQLPTMAPLTIQHFIKQSTHYAPNITRALTSSSSSSSSSSLSSPSLTTSDSGGDDAFHMIGISSLAVSGMLIVCLFVTYFLKKHHIHFVPHSVAAMIVGALVGCIGLLLPDRQSHSLVFSGNVFFFALLPPIILEAGYNMKRKNFFKNMTTILLFSILGTILSALLIGLGIYHASQSGKFGFEAMSISESFQFGALISCVDSVAVLAILGSKEINADVVLYAIVFGESVLNDAVCIVLFDALRTSSESIDSNGILSMSGTFIKIMVGSIALGCATGLLCSFAFYRMKLHEHPAIEATLIFLFAYCSYTAAEVAQLSGVMSLFFCGIMLAHYNWYNISQESRSTTRHGISALSLAAETFVYIYLGITFTVSFNASFNYSWSIPLILVTTGLAMLARLIHCFLCAGIANIKRTKKLSINMIIMMWFGGSVRGAVAFALALNVAGDKRVEGLIITTTLAVVILTTVVCGGAMSRVARLLKVQNSEGTRQRLISVDANLGHLGLTDFNRDPADEPDEDITSSGHRAGGLHGCFKRFDQHIMKPLFGGQSMDRTFGEEERVY